MPSTEKIVEIINHLILRKTDGKGLDETLNTKSGLLGISSVSGDMRQVIAAMRCGNGRAQLAFDISSTGCHCGIGSMLAALGVADAIVFTTGTPRHAATLRFWGSTSIRTKTPAVNADQDIGATGAKVRVLVVGPGRLGDRAGMLAAAFEYQPS